MSTTVTAIVIALLVVLFLLSATFLFFFLRRRRSFSHSRAASYHPYPPVSPYAASSSTLLRGDTSMGSGQNHTITPFGIPSSSLSETPRFHHTPGQNMRIATRRLDGAWEFGDPRQFSPSTPGGVREVDSDVVPSPSPLVRASRDLLNTPVSANGPDTAFEFPPRHRPPSSSTLLSTTTTGGYQSAKEREAKRMERKAGAAFDEWEPNPDILPPPAYAYGRTLEEGGWSPLSEHMEASQVKRY